MIFFEVRCHRAKAGISKRDRSMNRAGMPSHTLDYRIGIFKFRFVFSHAFGPLAFDFLAYRIKERIFLRSLAWRSNLNTELRLYLFPILFGDPLCERFVILVLGPLRMHDFYPEFLGGQARQPVEGPKLI